MMEKSALAGERGWGARPPCELLKNNLQSKMTNFNRELQNKLIA
jgi:hypothetical protein